MEDNVVYILYQSFIFLLRFAKISSCVYLLSSSSADLSASSRAGSTPATAFPHQKTAFYKFIQFLYTDISNTLFITHFCQFGCLVCRDAGIDDFLDIAVHNLVQLIQRQTDSVVGYTSLWEVVSTNLFRTVTCTNLASSRICFRIMCLLNL